MGSRPVTFCRERRSTQTVRRAVGSGWPCSRCSGQGSRPLGCGQRREQGSRRVRRSVQERPQGREESAASLSRRGRRLSLGLKLGPGPGWGLGHLLLLFPTPSLWPGEAACPARGCGARGRAGWSRAARRRGTPVTSEPAPERAARRHRRAGPCWGCETEDKAAASGRAPAGTAGRLRASLHLAPSRSSACRPQDARAGRTRCCAGLPPGEPRREKGVGASAGLDAVGWRGRWLGEVCVSLPLRTRSYLESYRQESSDQAGAKSSWEQKMKSGSRQTVHRLQG